MQPAIRYYKLDNRALSFADCWHLTKDPSFLFLAAAKLLRLPLDFQTYLPEHRHLSGQISREEEVPLETLAELEPRRQELEALGYKWPIFHSLRDELVPTKSHALAMVSPDGRTIAKVICVIQTQGLQKIKNVVIAFVSPLESGRFACTGSPSKGFAPNPRVTVSRTSFKDIPRLLAAHEKHLTSIRRDAVRPLHSYDDFINVTDDYEGMHIREKVEQGVYKEMTEAEIAQVRNARVQRAPMPVVPLAKDASIPSVVTAAAAGVHGSGASANGYPTPVDVAGTADEPPRILSEGAAHVQLEIVRQQNPKESWKGNAGLLVLTAVLFAFSFKGGMEWSRLGILMFVLVIHELGHYAAMKVFGYRNVRMFFLPFFGAAVSGRKYGVEAWRKAIVSLAGPIPGIVIGAAIIFTGNPERPDWVGMLSIMFLVLNLFNLAPILPLDGGWFWHAILFSRHPLADTIFRVATSVVLIAVSLLVFNSVLLAVVGGFMLMAVPHAHKAGRIATDLRNSGAVPAEAANLQEVPPLFTELALARMQAAMPGKQLHTKQAAQVVLDIFERVTSRPAGIVPSVLLSLAYFGSVLLGVLMVALPFLVRLAENMEAGR